MLSLMAEGRSSGAIAGILVISERAVEKHISNIFSKLGLAPPTPTTAGWGRPPLPGVLAGGTAGPPAKGPPAILAAAVVPGHRNSEPA